MESRPSEWALRQEARRVIPRFLSEWTGLPANVVGASEGQAGGDINSPDLVVQLGPLTFLVEIEGKADVATVARAAERAAAHASHAGEDRNGTIPLLVVPYMAETARMRCEAEGLAWLDLSGNARIHVEAPLHLHVSIEGKANRFTKRGRPKNAFAPKAARLARFLLLHPGRSFTQREIAEAAGLDEGYVSRLARRLEEQDLLARDEHGALQPADYDLLLDAWAEHNAFRHDQLTGHLPGRSGEQVVQRLSEAFEASGITYAVTGLAAAWAYTHAAGFRTVTVYLREQPPEEVLESLGFRRDSNAPNLTLLRPDDEGVFQGSQKPEGFWCAAPVQVYVDLQQAPERAEEFAEALRTQYLDWNAAREVTDA